MKGMKIFIGQEAEGPDKGTATLFLPSCGRWKIDEVHSILRREKGIQRIYFGAGGRRGLSKQEAELAARLVDQGHNVVAEFSIDNLEGISSLDILAMIESVLWIPLPSSVVLDNLYERMKRISSIKLEDRRGNLSWHCIRSCSITRADESMYGTDKEV